VSKSGSERSEWTDLGMPIERGERVNWRKPRGKGVAKDEPGLSLLYSGV
jgi:hypothetical protein